MNMIVTFQILSKERFFGDKCTVCKWSHKEWNRSDPRHLELHHRSLICKAVRTRKAISLPYAPFVMMIYTEKDKMHGGVPGFTDDMGIASYVLAGTQKAMEDTFDSTCHGAGRVLSRKAAKKASKGRTMQRELEDKGILVRWTGRSTLAEEMPDAYKDISQVVEVVHGAGISKKVAKLRPIAVVKG